MWLLTLVGEKPYVIVSNMQIKSHILGLQLLDHLSLICMKDIFIWRGNISLTLMPSKRDRALRGLSALRVLKDLMAPSSEYPMALAVILTSET